MKQEFSANGASLNFGKGDFDRIAATLNSYSSQVVTIKSRMNYNLKSKSGIDKALSAVSTNLSGCSSKLSALGQKLSEASRCYEAVENRLCSAGVNSGKNNTAAASDDGGEDPDANSLIKKLFKQFQGIFKGIDKFSDDRDAEISSTLISYITSIFSLITGDKDNPTETWGNWFNLVDKSAALEKGIYNYFEKGMKPIEASRFYAKYADKIQYISILGDLFGFAEDGMGLKSAFDDPESSVYKVRSELMKFWGSGLKVIGNTYIVTEFGKKTLRYVTPEGINQILATGKLEFGASKAMKAKAKRAGAYIAVGDVVISTFAGGYEKYGECIRDGKIDGGDVGSIGTRAACDGLSSVANGLTFGLVDIDGEQWANNLEGRCDGFVQNGGTLVDYIADKNNPAVLRFLASECAAAKIIADEAANGLKTGAEKVVEGTKSAASWIRNKWNSFAY